jgi:ribosome-binding protein aMBF1 (putative translation factor)
MEHQNWKPQIINKYKPKENKPNENKPNVRGKSQKLDIDDNPKIKKIDAKLSKLIREKRIVLGYNSQKDFAKKLNMNINDIKNCETVGCVYKPQVLSKIKRVLEINKNNS